MDKIKELMTEKNISRAQAVSIIDSVLEVVEVKEVIKKDKKNTRGK